MKKFLIFSIIASGILYAEPNFTIINEYNGSALDTDLPTVYNEIQDVNMTEIKNSCNQKITSCKEDEIPIYDKIGNGNCVGIVKCYTKDEYNTILQRKEAIELVGKNIGFEKSKQDDISNNMTEAQALAISKYINKVKETPKNALDAKIDEALGYMIEVLKDNNVDNLYHIKLYPNDDMLYRVTKDKLYDQLDRFIWIKRQKCRKPIDVLNKKYGKEELTCLLNDDKLLKVPEIADPYRFDNEINAITRDYTYSVMELRSGVIENRSADNDVENGFVRVVKNPESSLMSDKNFEMPAKIDKKPINPETKVIRLPTNEIIDFGHNFKQ